MESVIEFYFRIAKNLFNMSLEQNKGFIKMLVFPIIN